ncbi:MAG TPA: HAMP domain-containing sensor histidine kinase [Actinomycetota bacterium]|nr:HAMP domain-containing sensor histidine kinase [Actinomycetota bacterium]
MNPPGWLVDRLPEWARSIRFRYTLLYSAVLFGLAAVLIAAIYLVLLMHLRNQPYSSGPRNIFCIPGGQCFKAVTLREFERVVNSQTLKQLRNYSFGALGVLFVASLGVGWVVAGRVLRPIGRITSVARDIQATDLSRRIELPGPEDELKQLADTFDAMLARLDAAFAAQRQFTADASHELRNPLAIIRTNVDVALADPHADPEDLRHTIVVVKRASDRMARLVDDLLALARRQEPTLEHEPVDLGVAVAEASDDFVVPAAARQIFLDRAIAHGVVVMGDRDALKRAVANLLDNAVRLAPAGSRIRLSTGGEGDRAWIAVADEGPGISPEDQPHVFDRFWRADKARSRADGGSGLGLAIVRQIVESHGGEVRLQSKVGVGSSFVIWLPVTAASAVGMESSTEGLPGLSGPSPAPMPARTPTPAERARTRPSFGPPPK